MISNIELIHERAVAKSAIFHKEEAGLLNAIVEVDSAKVYLHYDCTSLFQYCLKYLNLSESNAYNFISVARKSQDVPELKVAIEFGDLSVSKARKIVPVLTRENCEPWIEMAMTLPKAELEKEVAFVAPKTLTPDRVVFVARDRLKFESGISEVLSEKLKRVQDLVSQQNKTAATHEHMLEAMADLFLEKHDPVVKAERRAKRDASKKAVSMSSTGAKPDSTDHEVSAEPVPGQVRSRHIRAGVRQKVDLRDRRQCVHRDMHGTRCQNRRWVQIHHVHEFAKGGEHDVQNLVTLCSVHHRLQHASRFH